MSRDSILTSILPEAIEFIKIAINGRNKVDYEKIKMLFDSNIFVSNNFADTYIDVQNFDWFSLKKDRNWWWQLQSLPFLGWYINSFDLQSKDERLRYMGCCLEAVKNWCIKSNGNDKSPLVWHDHASAFRLRNISNFLAYCDSVGFEKNNKTKIDLLEPLISVHLEWLQKDKNYSKHTNHGFDQAMIALKVSLMFLIENCEFYREKNKARLEDEIAFAFTSEGVHKENSPGYQKMMLARLKQLNLLKVLGAEDVYLFGKKYVDNAEFFLRAITLPNGYLPMIGDTKGNDKGLGYVQKNVIDFLLFLESGYIIVRGVVLNKDFHLIFKASHLSHYHRHDDDLSIHLYFDGKVLLGDGGLGSHNEKDKKRIALRSPTSHNVPYIEGKGAARKVVDLDGNHTEVFFSKGKILGKSFCFGNEITREIDLNKLEEGKITIKDTCVDSIDETLLVNYYSSEGLYESSNSLLVPQDENRALKLTLNGSQDFKEIDSYESEKYGIFTKNNAFSIKSNKDNQLECTLNLAYSKKELYSINYRGYGPILFKEAGNWYFDNNYPSNVCHHIMSLRWLGQIKDENVKENLLKSFITYHKQTKTNKSKFYLGINADHTASIRMLVLLDALKKSRRSSLFNVQLRKELLKTVRSCLKETYKKNNNHGLMVDKALLKVLLTDSYFLKKDGIDIQFVLDRVNDQLNSIFDDEGFCKEHSISYQEYNLGIALELLDVMHLGSSTLYNRELNSLIERVEKIKKASKKSLGFLLKDDGKYITIGDSFPEPKPHILKKAFGDEIPKKALSPESKEVGVFHNKTLGVSVFRSSKLHFVMNASWHSYVHKQNDDLGVFLRVNGEDVIIDGGYSDIISLDEVDTRSEYLHSTIIPFDMPWKNRAQSHQGFSCLGEPVLECKKVTLSGVHNRVLGCEISRQVVINEIEKTIKFKDELDQNKFCIHRFIIPNNFKFTIEGNSILLKSEVNSISIEPSFDSALSRNNYNSSPNLEIGWRSLQGVNGVVDNLMCEHLVLEFVSHGKVEFLVSYE